MTKTEFPAAIKSRPVYGVLAPRPGAMHLIVADGEGGEAVVDLLAKAPDRAFFVCRTADFAQRLDRGVPALQAAFRLGPHGKGSPP